jgi:hypothetical protein
MKAKIGPAMTQWSKQLTKTNFERFILYFSESLARSLEGLILSKKYHQLGAILLDKV